MPNWEPRARLGINLGPSPRHAVSVSLLLNLQISMVSPQFHISYDNFFKTVRPTSRNPPVYSPWKALTSLQKLEQPARDPKITPPKRVECPEAIIIRDDPDPPSE